MLCQEGKACPGDRLMELLDRLLGGAEVCLVSICLGWLLLACANPTRWRVTRAAPLSLLLALTVAQPFGIVAERRTALPPQAKRIDAGGLHVARLFGLPVAPFALYYREDLDNGFTENQSTATVRARSWLWLPLLKNATEVAELCKDAFSPCWRPDLPLGAESDYANTLEVFAADGAHWARIENPDAGRFPLGTAPESFTWKLRVGIASPAGVVFWLLASALSLVGFSRRRRTFA